MLRTVHVFGLCVFCLEMGIELLTECKWTDLVRYDGVEVLVLDWLSCLLSLHVLLTTAAQRMDMMHVHTLYVVMYIKVSSHLDCCSVRTAVISIEDFVVGSTVVILAVLFLHTYIPPSLVPWR